MNRRNFLKTAGLFAAMPLISLRPQEINRGVIAIEGNSQNTELFNYPGGIGRLLAARPEFRAFKMGMINQSIGGSQVVQMHDRAQMLDLNLAGNMNYVFVNENVNTLSYYQGQFAYCEELLRGYCTNRVNAGWKVIVVDLIEAAGPDQASPAAVSYTRAQMEGYNEQIKKNWQDYAYGRLAMSETILGEKGIWANRDYFEADKLHLNFNGRNFLATEIMKWLTVELSTYYMPIIGQS